MADTTEQYIAEQHQAVAEQKLDAIIAEVRRLATENPEFVYKSINDRWQSENAPDGKLDFGWYGVESGKELNGCLYIHKTVNSEPTGGCVFGQAFLNLGYTPEQIKVLDTQYDAAGAIKALVTDLDWENETVQRKLDWCNDFQAEQDTSQTWGDALITADQED